ncbi:cytochrome c biogenesis protein [Spirulina sp. 06S082]|uniref:cytochrome c biogenesis protein n=1 Tax=Spirulina sp. 06S082 TaxID=3110248 RepID=UPI002B1F7CCD|nr:cytochrome c biogenesis protein CcsA [Spirulina sp. 06S082]MEA5470313.1 cytochrome c biogenesis protein CcsA [Spirulina sp. 06S082]
MIKIAKFLIGLCLGFLILAIPFSQFQSDPLDPLENIAIQLDGRKKPLDTVARETVAQIHGRTNYTPIDGQKLDYLQTYLSLWFNDRDWNKEPFILFSYRPLKEQVGLDPEQKYFSFQELLSSTIGNLILAAHQKEADNIELTRGDREAFTLENRLALMYNTVSNQALPLIPHPNDSQGTWEGINTAETYYTSEQLQPVLRDYDTLKQTYRDRPNNFTALGNAAQTLRDDLTQLSPTVYPAANTLKRETSFYHLHPFGKAWKLYSLAFVLMLLVTLFPVFEFYWGAMGVFASGLGIHAYGFLDRMAIAGRPPVTNMYESVIWVGFGVAAIAFLFELFTLTRPEKTPDSLKPSAFVPHIPTRTIRAKYYLLAAAPLSVVCLLLADSLPAILDPSITPLVPVLRDNFWLSIHVPTITLSYASFALALGLGHILLGHYFFAPEASERIRSLAKWNYGVLQVGVLLLTAGVILGGIWAHFSWGRFWGWDPKETWALIALMCYIIPLHGRLVGWLGDFGMAVTSVVSFNAVLMAWYGVNFVLGQGLHSYGFSTGGSELIVGSIVGVDLLFVLATAIKYKGWFSKSVTSNKSPVTHKETESVIS